MTIVPPRPPTPALPRKGEGDFRPRAESPPPPRLAGRLHLTEAPISPRPIGEREGPAPQAWEGEGGAQLSRCFLKQTRRRKLPLTFPSLPRRGAPSPRRMRGGGRR